MAVLPIASSMFFTAALNVAACTRKLTAERFSLAVFSSIVMNESLALYQRSSVSLSLKKISPYEAGEMFFTSNSPVTKGSISFVIVSSASPKVRASTTYISLTFFCPASSVWRS